MIICIIIIGNDEAHVTADWQKISDSSNTIMVMCLVLFIITLLTVCRTLWMIMRNNGYCVVLN